MSSSTTCTFTSPRGHQLSARLERPSGAPLGAVIFAHCFTGSKDSPVAQRLVNALTAQGFATLSFDFTGLGMAGSDEANSTLSADIEDLSAAADYLATVVAPPSLLIGHSLGGAAVLSAAADIPSVQAVATIAAPADRAHVRQLIADGGAQVMREGSGTAHIGGRTVTIGKSFLEDLEQQNPLEEISRFRGATLVLHSPVDQVVGIDNAEKIYIAARHPKSFISLHNADHLLSNEADSQYAATVIAAWAHRYLEEVPVAPTAADPERYSDSNASALNSGGFTTQMRARGFTLLADEPAAMGGAELGPTPYDFLNLALASCTSMTLRMYNDRKGWDLQDVETVVTHERVHADDCADCEHKDGHIGLFRRTIRLTGDLTDEQRAAFMRIADRCPVHRTLEGQLEIKTQLEAQHRQESSSSESRR